MNIYRRGVIFTSSIILSLFCFPQVGFGQNAIAPDKTLPVNTLVNFNSANKTYAITGGTQIGVNQFHSFQDFSVPTGNKAHFDTLPTTVNAISRVTGSNISNIDGLIKANGTTNLYLINPNGIVFGKDAKLEVGGTFGASTANSFKFPDGSEFSATNPQAPPLLNVNVPLGLQYGKSNNEATISNQGNLAAGQDLVINADKLDLQGSLKAGRDLALQAQNAIAVRDTITNPFLASAGGNLALQGNQGIDILALNHPQQMQFVSGGDLTLASDGVISADARFSSGGEFQVRSLAGQLAALTGLYNPIINSTGNVDIAANYNGSSLLIESQGNVRIQGDVTSNGGNITLSTNAGNISTGNLNASFSSTSGNEGNGGAVDLTANSGSITFASIDTSSRNNEGNGGAIALTASGDIINTGSFLSPIDKNVVLGSFSYSANENSGNGGNVTLTSTAGNITLQNGDIDSSSVSNSGNSGNSGNGGAISFNTNNGNITLNNSSSNSSSSTISSFENSGDSGNSGNGGAISFNTNNGNITLNNSSSLSSSSSFASIYKNSGNSGNGGAISFNANNGNIILNDSSSSSFTTTTTDRETDSGSDSDLGLGLELDLGLDVSSFSGISGNGGAISFYANIGNITLNNSSSLSSSLSGNSGNSGNGGAISFNANNGNINLNDSASTSFSFTLFGDAGNSGNGGAISFYANNGDIILNNSFSASNSNNGARGDSGNGGTISFNTNDGNITLNESSLSSSSGSNKNSGNGGAISFNANNGDITFNNSLLDAISYSDSGNSGNGGMLTFNANNGNINFNNSPAYSYSTSNSGISGDGGVIYFNAINGDITLNTSSSNSASYAIQGNSRNGGTIFFTANNGNITFNNSSSSSFSYAVGTSGNGGDQFISAPKGYLIASSGNSSLISASVSGDGQASGTGGNITLSAQTQIFGLELSTQSSSGRSGMVKINGFGDLKIADVLVSTSKTVSIPNLFGDVITFSVGAVGRSGDATVTGLGNLTFVNTLLNSATQGSDPAGNISITSPSFVTFQNSQILSNTNDKGIAGSVTVKAGREITIQDNSQILATTSGNGIGGNILFSAPQSITVTDKGKLAVETTGQMDNAGKAGNITFTTKQLTLTDGVLVSASTSGKGRAGDIFVKADDFAIANGAQIQTATSSIGDSGTIDVRVVNQFNLSGSETGLFANTLANSTGRGGDIFIDPESVTLRDGAQIAVGSLGAGIGGNINLTANLLTLLNGSSITAETASNNGGNITLNIPSILLLRSGSQISTTAGTDLAGGNGGDININAGFIVALPSENSDIFANAFTGKGGNINLITNAIFGLQFRPVLTLLSDITASSQFGVNGTVNINTPGVDPSKGLTNLPANISDASKLVTQKCFADRQDSAFVISGRGGIAASPADVISGNNLQENLGTPSSNQLASQSSQLVSQFPNPPANRIIEAQGWTINKQGQVSLVAEVPKAVPTPTWARQLQCR